MTAVVFAGPTIGAGEVAAVLDAECRPPAAQGDLYRAALRRPRCIGLIDGYFDGVPSVWHKEILWAMSEGIAVFGSASMGALRAAELCEFGMRGVGRIFRDYRDGRIEDDDEVAVLHAPAELGFRPLSEPMVSVRATVETAAAAGVLTRDPSPLLRAAKAIHYRDRSWGAILEAAEGVPAAELAAFRAWLPGGRADQKHADALEMLQRMSAWLASGAPAGPVDYAFEDTDVWRKLTARVEAEEAAGGREERLVLDELRLDDDRFRAVRQRALLRGLALDEAGRQGMQAARSDLLEAMSRHRAGHGLMRRRELMSWLDANRLDEAGYERLLREDLLIEAGAGMAPAELARHLLAELKWSGAFAEMRRRAAEKDRALAALPKAGTATGRGADRLNLLVRHFEGRLGRPIPDDLDGYARGLGLPDREELYRVLEREHLYCRQADPAGADRGD